MVAARLLSFERTHKKTVVARRPPSEDFASMAFVHNKTNTTWLKNNHPGETMNWHNLSTIVLVNC
jgi:hypothetical protein